jgi:outer membrane protein
MMKPMCVRPQRVLRRGTFWLFAMIVSITAVSTADGQTLPPQLPSGPLTLDQVLELAEARSESVGIARAGIARADGNLVRARSGLFPQLSAAASYDRALASEFEGLFGTTASPACVPFTLNQQAPIDLRLAEIERAIDCGAVGSNVLGGQIDEGGLQDLPFGRKNTWRASLTFSQNVYSGGRIGAEAAVAAAGRETAELALTNTRGQLLFDVTQAYYEAALSARLLEIARATLSQADATLTQVQAGFSAGTQPEFEVLRARVTRDNQSPLLIRQFVNREVALLRLKQLLDLPPTFDLQLADVLTDETLEPPPVFAPRVAAVEKVMGATNSTAVVAQGLQLPLPRRAAVDAAEAEMRQSVASLSLTQAQKKPSVSINSSYGRISYPSGFFSGLDNWRTNWTVGASVQMPILTGGRQRGDELAARADVEESRLRLQQIEELAGLDTRLAWAELMAARATWEASGGTVQQATRAYEIADVRYRAGVSTQLELTDSRLLLQQAEATRAQAARDVQVARARVALLPELPLGSTGTAPTVPTSSATRAPSQPQAPLQPLQQVGGIRTTAAPGTQTQVGR